MRRGFRSLGVAAVVTGVALAASVPLLSNSSGDVATASPALSREEAAAIVVSKGYETKVESSIWRSGGGLNALYAQPAGTADGDSQKVFFFLKDRFIGTDTPLDELGSRFVSITSGELPNQITITYDLYKTDDPRCCPTGGTAEATFSVASDQLIHSGRIPSENER